MEGLKDLIRNCHDYCEVAEKLLPFSQSEGFEFCDASSSSQSSEGGTDISRSIKWLIKRRAIIASMAALQRTKFLFSDSMGGITLYVTNFMVCRGKMISILVLKTATKRATDQFQRVQ